MLWFAAGMNLDATFSTTYLGALMMGLFSSMHCLGMCGSIIGTLTLSLRQEIRDQKRLLIPYVASYNFGRITSYTLGGLFAGVLHHVLTLPLADGQGHRVLQIVSALFMAGAGLYIAGWFPRFAYIERLGGLLWKRLEPIGRRLIPVNNIFQAYFFGMVWGWLPCGLVYAALAIAATAGDVTRSTFTMLSFGLGTLPVVMGVGIMTSAFARLSRNKQYKQIAGLFMIAMALLAAFPELIPMRMHGM